MRDRKRDRDEREKEKELQRDREVERDRIRRDREYDLDRERPGHSHMQAPQQHRPPPPSSSHSGLPHMHSAGSANGPSAHPRRKLIPTLCTIITTHALTTIMLYTAITLLRRPCHTLEERRPSSIVRDQIGNMNALFLYKDLCMSGLDKVIQLSSSHFLRIKEKHQRTGQARTSTSCNIIRTWLIIVIENVTRLTERDPRETRARWSLADAPLGLQCLLSTTAATVPWLCPSSWRLVIRCNRRLLECHPRT